MADVLTAAALFILAATAVALFRVLRSGVVAERMMAVQLLGTGGAAALLLLGSASGSAAASDVALLLALFAAFACVAFVIGAAEPEAEPDRPEERP